MTQSHTTDGETILTGALQDQAALYGVLMKMRDLGLTLVSVRRVEPEWRWGKTMTFQEKTLYHQIHPLKLFTDWSTGIVALYPLWQHDLITALVIAVVPTVIISLLLVRFAHLERYEESRFGKYIGKYMTRAMEMLRFVGYGVMALGAWLHLVWLIPLGLLVIVLAWFRGVIFPH
jgi:hypothetical protein